MNRLDLAKRLANEAGITPKGGGPSTTISQTGEAGRVVDWVDTSYRDILNMFNGRWNFLKTLYAESITSGTSEYTPTAFGLTDHGEWVKDDVRCYLTATGVTDEQEIFWYPYDDFRRSYMFGAQSTQTGRPTAFTYAPDDSVLFWPIPDAAYTIRGEYFYVPVDMADDSTATNADTAEPCFKDRFHMLIVWRALIYYAADYIEPDKYSTAQSEYKRIKRQLELAELPEWKI